MTIYHKHHIVPRHMGGTDDPSNLIRLTLEEHAQAHLELYEQYGNKRDWIAHRCLLGQISFAEARLEVSRLPKTDQWKKQQSERVSGKGNPNWGNFGEKNHFYGKKHTEKSLEKMRGPRADTSKMKFRENNSTKITCPHCGKEGQLTNMKRWHFDNCKHQSQRDW